MKIFCIQFILFFFVFFGIHASGASEVREINAEAGIKSIKINWQSNSLTENESAVLFKKENACPEIYGDGEEIYRGSGNNYEDKNALKGKKYCYAVFVYDLSGRVSEKKQTEIVGKMGLGEYVAGFLIAKNNIFIVSEIAVFLFLAWINLKKRGVFEKKRKLQILNIDDD